MSKTTAKLSENKRSMRCSNCFQWYPPWSAGLWYCNCFLPSFYINQLPEKLYIWLLK